MRPVDVKEIQTAICRLGFVLLPHTCAKTDLFVKHVAGGLIHCERTGSLRNKLFGHVLYYTSKWKETFVVYKQIDGIEEHVIYRLGVKRVGFKKSATTFFSSKGKPCEETQLFLDRVDLLEHLLQTLDCE